MRDRMINDHTRFQTTVTIGRTAALRAGPHMRIPGRKIAAGKLTKASSQFADSVPTDC
jgi:hypothetical protein